MSGPYTIGPSGTYSSFTAAISDLTTNGVSGAVTFTVAAGTYNEQPVIGKITGASATNTITFVGQTDSSKVIITSASSASSTTDYTLELNASRYVTFKKITIKRTGTSTYATNVLFTGGTFHCSLQSCLLIAPVTPDAGSIAAGEPCVYINTIDTGDVFNNNHIKFGFNGLCFGTAGYQNVVSNNIIDSGGMAGLYVIGSYQYKLAITGNTFNAGTVTNGTTSSSLAYGIRFESGESFTITKNKFYATSATAATCRCLVMFFTTYDGTTRNLVANNFFWVSAGTAASTGITLGSASYTDIDYNNVMMTSTPTNPGAALYIYPQYSGVGITVRDNNLVNKGGGYCIDNELDTVSNYSNGLAIEDYNNLYTTGSYVAFYAGGTTATKYSTLSSYQSACLVGGGEAHSISADPAYKSTSSPYYDLHESSGAVYQAGTPIGNVTVDIDGDARPSTKPCIGADEFVPVFIDAGVTVLDSPTTYCYPVAKNVVVQFTNYGLNTLTSATIGWSINGTAQTSYSWSGSLVSAATSSKITLGSFSFNAKTPYTIKVWTTSPNSSTDQNHNNDTLTLIRQSGLSGTYYIGGTSPDYTSFNNALTALNTYGVCGPTTFRVRNGTYAEQLGLPNIAAMSSTNTVTFQSDAGDSSKVILTQATSNSTSSGALANNSTVQFNAAKWFIFKQITIQKTGALITQNVVQFANGANNNTITNCRLIGVVGSTTTGSNTGGDVIWSDSTTSTTETNNTFTNNAFKYGYSAINFTGQTVSRGTGLVISGNTIDSTYGPGIIAANEDAVTITSNAITNIMGTSYSGIQLTRSNGAISIRKNQIKMPNGAFAGIYLLYSNATSGAPGTIANNYVSINSTSAPRGIFDSSSTYQNFYFNTVDLYGTNTGADFYANAASGNINATDNLWYNAGSGYDIKVPVTSSLASSDYNDMYTSGSNVGLWGATNTSNLSAWQTASGQGTHSVSINPIFASNSDYKTSLHALIGLGTPIGGITTDIAGNTRNTITPSMGAWEIRYANDAGVSSITNPAGATVCAGTSAIKVVLKNYGTATLTSATIGWSVNGTAQTAYSFSGSVAPGSSTTVTVGNFNFSGSTAALKVWASGPNGGVDSVPNNDTSSAAFTVKAAPAANAGSNASVCPGFSAPIGAAAVAGSTYSWASTPSGYSSTTSSASVTPAVTTSYTVTETNAGGCSASNSVTITLNPKPAAQVASNSAMCPGASVSIGAASVAGSTYAWTSSPAGFSSTSSNPSVSPASTTSYTLTETSSLGCTGSNSVTITVNPAPSANTGPAATICSGNSITIGGTAVSGNTYSWTSSPSGYASTSSKTVVSPLVTTTYTLVESVSSGCSASNSVTITVNPLPAANAGSSAAVCAGSSASIGATVVAGDNYSWTSNPSGFTSTSSSASVTPTASTVYSLTETNPSTGCSKTNTVLITVNPLPAAFTGSAAAVCSGSPTITIGGTAVTGNTYSWSPTTGLSSSTASNPTATLTGTTTYTLTEKVTATGCSKSNNVTITYNNSPAANAGTSQAICYGASVGIGASSVSGDTYSWSPTSGLSSATSSGPTATPTSTTTYALTEKVTSTGCSTTKSVTITVNPLPAAYVGQNSVVPVCSGQSVTIGGAAVTGSLYSWTSKPTGFTSTVSSSSVAPVDTTVYTLTETSTITGCSASNTIAVDVIPLPLAKITTAPVCIGSNGVVVANTASGYHFQWYLNGTLQPKDTGFRVITNVGGAYSALVTNSNTGCSAMSNIAIMVVNQLPNTLVKTIGSAVGCDGDSLTLIAPLDANNLYSWRLNGDTISGAHGNIYIAKKTGSYQVMVTSNLTKCSDTSTSLPVTMNPRPAAPLNVLGTTTVCSGQDVAFHTSQSSGAHYSWFKNNVAIANTDSNNYSATTTGNYSVQITNVASGCSQMSASVPVTVNPLPLTTISATGNTNLCPGSSVLLIAGNNPAYTYRWLNDNGYLAGATGDTITVTQASHYSVTATSSAGCRANSNQILVTAASYPKVSIVRPSKTVYCQDTLTLAANDSNAGSIQWYMNGNMISGAIDSSLVVTQTGLYTITVNGTKTCKASDTISITENGIPSVAFYLAKDTFCEGTSMEFVNLSSISSGSLKYIWTFGNGDTSRAESPVYSYTHPGKYYVHLIATSPAGCSSTLTDSVTSLVVDSSAFSSLFEGGRREGFTAHENDSTAHYVWDFGDGVLASGITSYHEYAADGSYRVKLTVLNANGCSSTTTNLVTVRLSGIAQTETENLSIRIYPNPFKTQTNILYSLKNNSSVEIEAFDINGKQVAHVDNTLEPAGDHSYIFNGPVPGIYFIKMTIDGQPYVSKVVQQ